MATVNVPPLNLPHQLPALVDEENEDTDAVLALLKQIINELLLWVDKLRVLNP